MKGLWILALFICLVSCDFSSDSYSYSVTGTANAVDVTLNNSDGGIEQYSSIPLPYNYSLGEYPGYMYISAQNCGSSGSITVKILNHGATEKSATSTGAYCIATVDE